MNSKVTNIVAPGNEIYFIKLALFVFRPLTGKQKLNLGVLFAFAVNKYISLKIQILI